MASMKELFAGIRRCEKCERCQTRNLAVPGEGEMKKKILLIGEAPGKEEDKNGRPFQGRAGTYLDGVFRDFGLRREDVYITSILKCYHPGPPRNHQVEACRPWTVRQVEQMGPEVILIMGLTAARGLLDFEKLGDEPAEAEWRSVPCVVTCHPASAMRFPGRDGQFRDGLQRAMRFRE